jgi:hypothetical protein
MSNRTDSKIKLNGGAITTAYADTDHMAFNEIISQIPVVKPDKTRLNRVLSRASADRVLRGEDSIQELFDKYDLWPVRVPGGEVQQ